jgi:DNA invertase Pin-like site-specific DNA recombinase
MNSFVVFYIYKSIDNERYNMTTIGYIRVSSSKQTLEHQEFEIKKFAQEQNIQIDRWVKETISSQKSLQKRQLGRLLDELQEGDILIACEISRLGRSLLEVMRILEVCLNKNCQVWTLKENYRLGNDIQSKVMAFAFGLSAEIERNLISQRTKQSLENVRITGKKLGRPFSVQSQKLKLSQNTKKIKELRDNNISITQISKVLKVQRMTVYRFLDRMGWK